MKFKGIKPCSCTSHNIIIRKKSLTLNMLKARLCNFILCVHRKHYLLTQISFPAMHHALMYKIPLHEKQSRHFGFHCSACRLVNILKLVSNAELHSATDNAKHYSSFLSSSSHHSSSSARGLLSITPFG